jgi:integrase
MKRPKGTGHVYRRGDVWWLKYHRMGKQYFESSRSGEKSEAEKLLAIRLGEIAGGRFRGLAPDRIKMADLFELVVEDYRQRKLRSVRDVEWRRDKHLIPAFGDLKASEFGSIQIKRYVALRRGEGAEDSTVNRELSIVRRGFNLALQSDPPLVIRTPFIAKLEEDNVREGFIEHAQYSALLKTLPDHLKAMFVGGYHVGNRAGELKKLTWSQVDLKVGEIRLNRKQTKGKKHRTLPIYGDMASWLEMQKTHRDEFWPDCELVFHYQGKPIGSHIKGWARSCASVGLVGLHFHDLRRSAVRNLARAVWSSAEDRHVDHRPQNRVNLSAV